MNFIIPPFKKPCMHVSCGSARSAEGAVMNCPDCGDIVQAVEVELGYSWRKRSQRWLNRQLRKLEKKNERDRSSK